MFNIITLVFSLCWLIYGIYQYRRIKKIEKITEEDISEELINKLKSDINNPDFIKIILKDYEITNNEIERRENITLVVGTILIGSSFLILGQTLFIDEPEFKFLSSCASILLYALWLLILHRTTRNIDNLTYPRLRLLEKIIDIKVKYGFGVHRFLKNKLEEEEKKGEKWIWRRRGFWYLTLILLSGCWFFSSVISILLSEITIQTILNFFDC